MSENKNTAMAEKQRRARLVRKHAPQILQSLKEILRYWDIHEQNSCGARCTVCTARDVVALVENNSGAAK